MDELGRGFKIDVEPPSPSWPDDEPQPTLWIPIDPEERKAEKPILDDWREEWHSFYRTHGEEPDSVIMGKRPYARLCYHLRHSHLSAPLLLEFENIPIVLDLEGRHDRIKFIANPSRELVRHLRNYGKR